MSDYDYYRFKSKRQYYGGSGVVRILIGLLFVLGTVGNFDFYDECLAAADCVAGDPPSLLSAIITGSIGFGLILWGAFAARAYEEEKW